ncbi:MAG: hypothetical protein Hals2KO_21520 [Halioglobus sp.]
MEVNKVELAEIFGVDERTLTRWQHKGMPIRMKGRRGESNTYETKEVIAWLLAREKDNEKESAKERLDRLRGDYEEIKIAKELGQLAPPEDYERVFGGMVESANEELLNFTDTLIATAKSLHNIDIPAQLVESKIEEVILRLSNYDAFDIAEPEGEGDDEEDGEADFAGGVE